MNNSTGTNNTTRQKVNQNIQVYVRVRPLNTREKGIRSNEVVDVVSPKEILTRHVVDSKLTKKFTFDRTFGPESKQSEVYSIVVSPLIEEVLSGYNCTVFAYGQTGTGKTHTMIGTECVDLQSSWHDDSDIGIIPRALSHLFDELRLMELEFSMRISYLELYNEELCDLLSSDDSTKIRIFDDSTKKGSVIIQGLEEIIVHSKNDVYKLLEKGKERRKTATTLMNAQSSRSHTVFSITVHIKENGMDGEEMLKIGKLNLVDLAGSENVSKAGNEKGIRVRETVNINQSLLTLGRVITALVERTPHIPYRESKLTRLLQESLGGRTKTSIIATISPGHKDIEETLSTLEYAHRAKNIQNRPEVNQKLTKKTVIKEYTEEIDKLKRDLLAARDKNGIYLAEETYNEINLKLESQNKELNEKMLLVKALKDDLSNKERIFNEVSLHLLEKTEVLRKTERNLSETHGQLQQTKKILTTTKQRYKEKKVLLESHVKTEEELTNQATKILEVADIATNDTVQLHHTIERRKDVDVKIQSACEQFSDRMQCNFELMDENLNTLQKDHADYSQLVVDEICNSSKLQNKLVTEAVEKVKSFAISCENSQTAFGETFKKYSTALSSASTDHYSVLQAFFVELRNEQDKLNTSLQGSFTDVFAIFAQQKTLIANVNQAIGEQIVEIHSALKAHSADVKRQLKEFSDNSQQMFQREISAIKTTTDTQNALNVRRQQILAECMRQMQEVDVQQDAISDNLGGIANNINNGLVHMSTTMAEKSEKVGAFCNERVENLKKVKLTSQEFTEEVLPNLDQCSQKLVTAGNTINNHCQESGRRIDSVSAAVETNYTNSASILLSHGEEFNRIQTQSQTDINAECWAVCSLISDGCTRLKECTTQTKAFTASLKNNVRDYASVYKEQMDTCVSNLSSFRKRELKTYVPTGSTPSKREFSYPRILAATSPHSRIVKRLRQENDWSDLDTTATIDEEDSETTIHNLSDTQTILNSTPIEVKDPVKRDSGNHQDVNVLSVPQRYDSNRKPKSPLLGRYSKDNKENVYRSS